MKITPKQVGEAMRNPEHCPQCYGCGLVADTKEAESWMEWQALPPGSDLAVQMGLVQPETCPSCDGSGLRSTGTAS